MTCWVHLSVSLGEVMVGFSFTPAGWCLLPSPSGGLWEAGSWLHIHGDLLLLWSLHEDWAAEEGEGGGEAESRHGEELLG